MKTVNMELIILNENSKTWKVETITGFFWLKNAVDAEDAVNQVDELEKIWDERVDIVTLIQGDEPKTAINKRNYTY